MNTLIYLLASAIVAFAGFASALAFLGKDHKDVLLSSDSDGVDPIVLGVLLIGSGFVADNINLVAGYLFKVLGLIIVSLGMWILLPKNPTDKLLHPALGIVYALVAAAAYIWGTTETSGLFGYNMYALKVLVPLTAGATFSAVLAAFSFASQWFKDRLASDDGGFRLIGAGVVLMLLAPIGALVIVTAALGALLTTLGLLIVFDQKMTLGLLQKRWAIIWVAFTIGLLAAASVL